MANDPDIEEVKKFFEYREGNLYWKVSKSVRALAGSVAGSLSSHGYIDVGFNGKLLRAHRLIFAMHHGFYPKQIDHINGVRNDNRIENLRAADFQTNAFNSIGKGAASGIKNVYWRENRKHWFVKLCVLDRQILFGSYRDLELAELVAIEARNKYHGEFANHE